MSTFTRGFLFFGLKTHPLRNPSWQGREQEDPSETLLAPTQGTNTSPCTPGGWMGPILPDPQKASAWSWTQPGTAALG